MTPHAVSLAPAFSRGFTGPLALAYGLAVVLAWPQGMTPAIWSLYMQDRGASLLLIGLSYAAFALAAAALAPVAGRLSDRYGRWHPRLAGLVLAGVVYCAYGLRLPLGWIMGLTLV